MFFVVAVVVVVVFSQITPEAEIAPLWVVSLLGNFSHLFRDNRHALIHDGEQAWLWIC